MKYLQEYRDPAAVRALLSELQRVLDEAPPEQPHTLMEICGGQTHAIMKYGLDALLPEGIRLIHGPGCPVCVTPLEQIDMALELASRDGVILCSFGDMLRVPGSRGDLQQARAQGGDVRVVYSPLDALAWAEKEPTKQVVFFSVGFETTAPATAMAVKLAAQKQLDNFCALVSHVLVPPAMHAILSSEENQVTGFLAAGHVCTVMGVEAYAPIAQRYGVPIVVTGFEPTDILRGILGCVRQLQRGEARVENAYARSVQAHGNLAAQQMLREIFCVVHRKWRGLGPIEHSGLALAEAYAGFDAQRRFGLSDYAVDEPPECRSGEVLQGRISPLECPAFGQRCTPERPLGAPMVSSEGACAAYYLYRTQE